MDPRNIPRFMIAALVLAIMLWLALWGRSVAACELPEDWETPTAYEAYIVDAMRFLGDDRTALALQLLPQAVAAAERYEVDTALMVVTVTRESRWAPWAVSKRGARGLGQLMPQYNPPEAFGSPFAQLGWAAIRMQRAQGRCRTPLQAVNEYLTGRCAPFVPEAWRRYKAYLRLKRRAGV